MIFRQPIKIEFPGEDVLLGMEDLLLVQFHTPGCMVKLIWKPKFINLNRKHTVQFWEPLKLKLMPLLGYILLF